MSGRVSKIRSKTMAAVKSKNTSPEILLRKYLTQLGLRYRLYRSDLPGRPDIIFSKYKIVVFCDGDFWHGRHLKKRLAKGQLKVRRKYWIAKIEGNIRRDKIINRELKKEGWTVLRFWETDIYKRGQTIAAEIDKIIKVRET